MTERRRRTMIESQLDHECEDEAGRRQGVGLARDGPIRRASLSRESASSRESYQQPNCPPDMASSTGRGVDTPVGFVEVRRMMGYVQEGCSMS